MRSWLAIRSSLGSMRAIVDFLRRLHDNNDREWFDAHRAEWLQVKGQFAAFTERLIAGIASFDNTVAGLRAQDCTYRIARDTRFSPDKTPYKTHVSAFIAPRGKKSGYAGYYFHIEPTGDGMIGSSLLASGIYCPDPVILRSIRDEIFDNGVEFSAAIRAASGFALDEESKLKRLPTGYKTSEFEELLKLKNFGLDRPIPESWLDAPDLLERSVEAFRLTLPFVTILNRAVRYANEEMR